MVFDKETLIAAHRGIFGEDGDVTVARAPGRANLIGEHTDQALGFVLPVAIELATYVCRSINRQGELRIYSDYTEEQREWRTDGIAGCKPAGDWTDYPIGVARELIAAGRSIAPSDLSVWSEVPDGAGLSSSAAIEVATALALLDTRPMDRMELAKLCRRAENGFVGVPSGLMDQFISLYGVRGAAVKLDCRSLDYENVALPRDVEILAVNTMVKHELSGGEYGKRVEDCREAVREIQKTRPEVDSLRDATPSDLELLSGNPRKRARHIMTENARVLDFIDACHRGDIAAIGRLMHASHVSLRDDYEVSCAELDALVEIAEKFTRAIGSRMMGGGFGGCTINILHPRDVPGFSATITELYSQRYDLVPQIYSCQPVEGAGYL